MKKITLLLCLFFAGCATISGGAEKNSCPLSKSHCQSCTHCSPECRCKK